MNAKGYLILFLFIFPIQIFLLWFFQPGIETNFIFIMLGFFLISLVSIDSNINSIMEFLFKDKSENSNISNYSNEYKDLKKQIDEIQKTLSNIDYNLDFTTNKNLKLILGKIEEIIYIYKNTECDSNQILKDNISGLEDKINFNLKQISENIYKIVRLGEIIIENKEIK